jgi:hypothetical protein
MAGALKRKNNDPLKRIEDSMTETDARRPAAVRYRAMKVLGAIVVWFALLLLNLCALAAIYLDCRIPALRIPLIVAYAAVLIFLLVRVKGWRAVSCFGCFCVVLAW